MAISEFQSKNRFLTLIIENKTFQFKPVISKDGSESQNGVLSGDFTAKEIKAIGLFEGVLKTK